MKRFILSAIILAAVVVLAAAGSVPLLVSSDLVRDRLERDMSAWTGHDVSLGISPELTFWPTPSIRLRNVLIRSRSEQRAQPLVYADSVTAEFSFLSALSGKPSFSNFRFMRPVFTVERSPGGAINWETGTGRITEAVAIAKANAEAAEQNKTDPAGIPYPSEPLGEIAVSDGTVKLIDDARGTSETIGKVNGTIDWGRLDGGLTVSASGVVRGETARITLSSSRPLTLFAGRNAPLTAVFQSDPLNINFDGQANISDTPFFGGKLTLTSQSVRKALAWIGTDIKPGEAIGALTIEATATTQKDRINLDDLILEIDDNKGIGVLDVQFPPDKVPVVAGTLAFNRLNITSFLRAFTPLPRTGEDISAIDTRFLRQLGLDLRLSAQTATLGPLTMTNLGAAARIDQGRAIFDVGDATAYGGTVIGKVEISESGLDGGGEVQISARNTDFGSMFDALKITGPLPRGTGSLDVMLRSAHPLWATGPGDIEGTFKIAMNNGTVPSFDLATFRSLSGKERFFDLSKAASGSFAFQTADFEGQFSDGLAEIDRGEIVSDRYVIGLNGVIPYEQGSLAMAGTLSPKPAKDDAAQAAQGTQAIQPVPPATAPGTSGTAPAAPAAGDAAAPSGGGQTAGGSGAQAQAQAPAMSTNAAGTPPPAAAAASRPLLQFFIGGSWPSPVISPVISN